MVKCLSTKLPSRTLLFLCLIKCAGFSLTASNAFKTLEENQSSDYKRSNGQEFIRQAASNKAEARHENLFHRKDLLSSKKRCCKGNFGVLLLPGVIPLQSDEKVKEYKRCLTEGSLFKKGVPTSKFDQQSYLLKRALTENEFLKARLIQEKQDVTSLEKKLRQYREGKEKLEMINTPLYGDINYQKQFPQVRSLLGLMQKKR